MLVPKNAKLLFIGDSITDCGRAQPVGDGPSGALGGGYVNQIDALLGAACPELGIRVVNMGISGNTVRDLEARWQRDVIDQKPDWVSIMIGANDVWRQFDMPKNAECHVGLAEYGETLEALVADASRCAAQVVVMTPFYVEPMRDDAMRSLMDLYGARARQVAERHRALIVDTQAAFDEALRHSYCCPLAPDRVHPTHVGHMVLARAWLKAVGFVF